MIRIAFPAEPRNVMEKVSEEIVSLLGVLAMKVEKRQKDDVILLEIDRPDKWNDQNVDMFVGTVASFANIRAQSMSC